MKRLSIEEEIILKVEKTKLESYEKGHDDGFYRGYLEGNDEGYENGYDDGLIVGSKENTILIVQNMLRDDFDFSVISSITSLSLKDIEKISEHYIF